MAACLRQKLMWIICSRLDFYGLLIARLLFLAQTILYLSKVNVILSVSSALSDDLWKVFDFIPRFDTIRTIALSEIIIWSPNASTSIQCH